MKQTLIRILLSTSSFSGVVLFWFIGKKPNIPYIELPVIWQGFPKYAIFILLIIVIARIVLWLASRVSNANDTLLVQSIKPMESAFLPAYIGLFVITLSLDGNFTSENIILLSLLFVFWVFLENVSYFNPFFLLFGYRFYEVTSSAGGQCTVITKKKDIRDVKNFESLIRISNFSYLQI